MAHLHYKTLIVKLNCEDYSHFMQFLEASGYKVDISKHSNVKGHAHNELTELTLNRNKPTLNNGDNALVQKTCLYIQKNLSNKLNLDDLAIEMGSNRSKLAAIFKDILGVGVFERIREYRMLKAKFLLLESQLSIQEIGFEVGYENSANFSTAFKKHFNVSPRQQRKLLTI